MFLLTLEATFPPAASMRAEACSRVRVGSVPVKTNVLPARRTDGFARGRFLALRVDVQFLHALQEARGPR